MSDNIKARLLLASVVAVWGATFALVKDALQDASPLVFNLLRMTLAFAVLAVVNWRRLRGLSRKTVLAGLGVGVFLAAGYQFQTAGLALTTPVKSAFITGLVVVLVPLLTIVPKLRPKGSGGPDLRALVAAAMAFTGLMLLTTPAGTALGRMFATIGLGDWLTLCCALAFAGHLLALAYASLDVPAGVLATLQIGAAAIVMLLTLPLGGRPALHLTTRLVVALLVTSVFATAAAFTVQSYAQQHLAPSHVALIVSLEPVFAAITSIVFLHERIGGRALTGAALMLAGIGVVELLPRKSVLEIPA